MSIENEKPEEGVEPSEGEETEKLVEEIATLKQSLANVVEETKEIRKDRATLREKVIELEKVGEKSPVVEKSEEVKSIVKEVLDGENASRAKTNKTAAIEKFTEDNKEFSKENDPTGMKREALESKLSTFNLDGLVEEKDFYSRIKEAKTLLGDFDTKPKASDDVVNPYSSSPTPDPNPTIVVDKDLTPAEKKLIDEKGWTKERYLKLKEKQPNFIESL